MPVYPRTPSVALRPPATMLPLNQGPATLTLPVTQAPNTPTGLALGQSAGGITASWTPGPVDSTHSAAAGYNLRYGPSGTNGWTVVSNVASPYVLTGLAPGMTYNVQVQSTNGAGLSGWSASVAASTAAAAPNAPAAPLLAQGTGSALTVTWTAPAVDAAHSPAAGYNLQYSPAEAGTWTAVTGVTSPYTLAGLAGTTAYSVEVQATNSGGEGAWSPATTLTTGAALPNPPNAPALSSVRPPADGTASNLVATWAAPAVDANHSAATGYNLRYGPSGSASWTVVTGVTSPYTINNLAGATAIDVQVQATNGAPSPGAWSATVTGTTWGATVATATWVAATTQTHNTSVAPNGGVNVTATPAPTTVASAVFAWSGDAVTVPTSGLIATTADGQPNGWGQWFNTPATAGTYYLWMLAQDSNGHTIGALVSPAITVS